jgi:hypothetical protein
MKTLPKDVFYLRAPLFTTRNRTKDFKFLHEKLEARLLGWQVNAYLGQVETQ